VIALWTKSKARLQFVSENAGENYNWLFLPGGPGLGSESLNDLIDILHLPGNIWKVDLPGDGSNNTEDDTQYFSHWSQALIEAVSALPNVILVAHSSGGMFALATPALENILTGLILMDSAPDASWQEFFTQYVKDHPLPETEKLQQKYDINPSNETLKQLTIACAPYFATAASMQSIITLLKKLPFNYKTHVWAAHHFDNTYQAKWIPGILPTLVFAGEYDYITPLNLFTARDDFKRDNITIKKISGGSHFPWYENPVEVKKMFDEFCQKLKLI